MGRVPTKMVIRNIMNNLIRKDLSYVWHPYTQMKNIENFPPIVIEKAKGAKIFDSNGKFYYDTISSWWCNVHGHNHPVIKRAVKKQLDAFEHIMFAGFTHKNAVELAEKLVLMTPDGLDKVFYSDNGSTAVEVAMKMSFQYWKNVKKNNKHCFLSLDRGYHGDTVGAMSVSGVDLFNSAFKPLFFKTFKAPAPYCYRCQFSKDRDTCSLECLLSMEKILEQNAEKISAILIEPMLMAAGGMIVYPVRYLKKARALAYKYDVHLIADEVATGFGRTGKMFASEHAGITPDFMCLSKGITSGYLPMGATLTTNEIFESFCDARDKLKTFYHGHTFTANPLACAAANASIELFETENTLGKIKRVSDALKLFLSRARHLPIVGDVRMIGAVGAIELVKDKADKKPFDSHSRIGMEVYKSALENNLLLRPLGNVIYFFLPACVRPGELEDIFSRAEHVLKSIIIP